MKHQQPNQKKVDVRFGKNLTYLQRNRKPKNLKMVQHVNNSYSKNTRNQRFLRQEFWRTGCFRTILPRVLIYSLCVYDCASTIVHKNENTYNPNWLPKHTHSSKKFSQKKPKQTKTFQAEISAAFSVQRTSPVHNAISHELSGFPTFCTVGGRGGPRKLDSGQLPKY